MTAAPRILVTGASGQLGGLVVAALLKRVPAAQVVAGVRDANGAAAARLAGLGVEVRPADYTKPQTPGRGSAGRRQAAADLVECARPTRRPAPQRHRGGGPRRRGPGRLHQRPARRDLAARPGRRAPRERGRPGRLGPAPRPAAQRLVHRKLHGLDRAGPGARRLHRRGRRRPHRLGRAGGPMPKPPRPSWPPATTRAGGSTNWPATTPTPWPVSPPSCRARPARPSPTRTSRRRISRRPCWAPACRPRLRPCWRTPTRRPRRARSSTTAAS